MNFKNFIKRYIDFSFNKFNIIPITVLIINFLVLRVFNITVIYENSWLENIQLVALIIPIFFALKVKSHKALFNFAAMFLILMIGREISYGRVFFGAIEGQPDGFYQWSDYKYGFLANYIVAIYIVFMFLYGLFNKIYLDIPLILRKIRLPFWSVFGCALCTFAQILGEGILHNTVLEETAELVLYTIIATLVIYYYRRLKRPIRLKQIHQ